MRVETFGIPNTVADSTRDIRRIATIAGQPGGAEPLVQRIEAAMAATAPGDPVPVILWQPGGIVPGEGTLIVQLMEAAGFANEAAARGLGQAQYLPLEAVLADPPSVLLVAGSEPAQRHAALRALDTKVARLPPALLYCGGPTIERAMRRLRQVRAQA